MSAIQASRGFARGVSSCALAFALAIVGSTHTAAATAAEPPQSETPADPQTAPADDIVVTGYAASLEKATELKRDARYSLDAVSAEDIGKFPTRNAAEALQLIPGVTLDRSRGEGLYISVRGLGPRFQQVTLNGNTIAVNDLIENGGVAGRSFRFEVLPTNAVQQISVAKTPSAEMADGALGGNIDVVTFKPLDLGRVTTLQARLAYNDLREKADPSISGLASWANADETFGVLVSALYDKRSVRNDRSFNFGWNLNQFTSVLGAGLYTPTRTRPTLELEDRTRGSATASMQWRPSSDLSTDFDMLVTRLDVDYDEHGLDIYPDARVTYPDFAAEAALYPSLAGLYAEANRIRLRQPNTSVYAAPAFVAGTQKVVGDTVVAGTINNVRWMASRETSLNRHDLAAFSLRQAWTPGRWEVSGNLAYSQARSYHPDGRATTRNRASFVAPLTFDFSRGYKEVPILTTPVDYTNPGNYVGQAFDYTSKDSRDTDESARLDVAHGFDGFLRRLAVGGEYQRRNRNYIRRDWSINPVFGVPLTQLGSNFVAQVPVDNYLSNFSGNSPRTWTSLSSTAFYDLIFNREVAGRAPDAASLRSSFIVDEKVYSGYLVGDFAAGLGSVELTGNVGVRYARTTQVSSGFSSVGTAVTPVSFEKEYDDWLPTFNARAALTNTLVMRLAAARTVNRPNVVDVAPRLTISRDSPTGSGGNPNLDPFRATQADLSLEWYFSRGGSLTGAAFYKKLDDFITAQNTTIDVPGRGDILLSTQVNGGSVKLKGLEFAYNQVFDFLPRPLEGLGAQASLTVVDVKSEYAAGNRTLTDRIIGLSKLSYNLVGYYEKGPFAGRIGYFWRDRYLDSNGSTTTSESYVAPFGSLDGSLSYELGQNYVVTLDAINLTGAVRYVYGKNENQPREINDYGRTITLTVRAKF